MPAGTVGAAYAEQKHIDRTGKPYRETVKGEYRVGELIRVLEGFSGLEEEVQKKETRR